MTSKITQHGDQQARVGEDDTLACKQNVDICQQLMDRYAKSLAPQHRHLVATAAAMRSILTSESLPLTPPGYFAAGISAAESAMSSPSMDFTAVSALLSFLSIVVPMVPPRSIATENASKAVGVLAMLVEREGDKLGVASLRAGVRCLGALLVGFCDLEDWNSVQSGFTSLLKFSIDKRPKVRKCAQEWMEKLFRSFKSSNVIKGASKLVYSLLKEHMPLARTISTTRAGKGSKDDMISTLESMEVSHLLNMLGVIIPFLSVKTRSKIFSELCKLISSEFSALTRQIFKAFDMYFGDSKEEIAIQDVENVITLLAQYMFIKEKKPADTVVHAATLSARALWKLHSMEATSCIKKLPLVCESITGLLTSMDDCCASQALVVLKDLINHHIDPNIILSLRNQPFEDDTCNSEEMVLIRSTCAVFERQLNDTTFNKHILAILSLWFQKLGELSHILMRNVIFKLADLMTSAGGDSSNSDFLQNCFGSAVAAMGPERILNLIPISYHSDDFTCSNTWLVPILRKHVVGASVRYYVKDIVPLAKSFLNAARRVSKAATGEELQAHGRSLLCLLPAFCHYATDIHKTFGSLVELIVIFLKKYPFMHEAIALSLQVLVNENKHIVAPNVGELSTHVMLDFGLGYENVTPYSKKVATRNLKVLALSSPKLLQALVDIFVDSSPGSCSHLKDAIGCLASITDSSVTKRIMISVLEKFNFLDGKADSQSLRIQSPESVDEEKEDSESTETQLKRRVIMDLVPSLVVGATDDFIALICDFVAQTFQKTEEIFHQEAYHALSRVVEEHDSFCSSHFVELVEMLLRLKAPADITSLRSRLACFYIILVHAFKMSEEGLERAFLILNEIILTLKDGREEARKAAYDVLAKIYTSLKSSCTDEADSPCHKLISMIMGYLSGSSPHIQSGAVSALSVFVYKDPEICLSKPDLILSVSSLLQGKAVEVIKAALGFMKVVVSCLEFKDPRNLLSDITAGILPWSSVSRHHFRNKVTVILEIMIRKCGPTAIEFVTPQNYKGFLKSVIENRSVKSASKVQDTNSETMMSGSPKSFRSMRRKRKHQEVNADEANDLAKKKVRRGKTGYSTPHGWNKPSVTASGDGSGKGTVKRPRHLNHEKKGARRDSTNGVRRNKEKQRMVKRVAPSSFGSASRSKFHKGNKVAKK